MRTIFIIAVLFLGLVGPAVSQDSSFYEPAPKPFAIILMGASWCPYCKRAALVLQPLAQKSNIDVLVVSWDNKPILPFKDFVPAHTTGPFSQLKTLPTTVLVDVNTHRILGLFEGFRNPNDYARRLRKLVQRGLAMKAKLACMVTLKRFHFLLGHHKKRKRTRLQGVDVSASRACKQMPCRPTAITTGAPILTVIALAWAVAPSATYSDTISDTFCKDGIQIGWHFYCDPDPEPEPMEEVKPEITKTAPPDPKKDDFKAAQQKLAVFANQVEELKARAILQPTEANLIAYMRIQKVMIDRAERFQKAWSLALYKTPELDHNTVSPLTNPGIFDFQDRLNAARKAKLAEISQTHVLMLVIERPEICFTCKTQTEIIARMIPKYDLPIFVVTKDGYTYPALPNAEHDQGNLKGLGLDQNPTPFLAIIDPKGGDVFQIGHGLLTEDLILARVLEVMSPSKLLDDRKVVNNDE